MGRQVRGVPRRVPEIPKRHMNAAFLGGLRARTAGQIIHLERIAKDIVNAITGDRHDMQGATIRAALAPLDASFRLEVR